MGRAEVLATIVAAVVLGAIVAVLPSADQRLSVDLWLVAVAAWAGIALTRRALGSVPNERDRLRVAVRFRPRPETGEPSLPRELLAIEGSLLATADNARSYEHRLRPRLRAVTGHRLRVNRGIDLDQEPERAERALGDVTWLIDGTTGGGDDVPAPTPAELTLLLDRSEPLGDGPPPDRPVDERPDDQDANHDWRDR